MSIKITNTNNVTKDLIKRIFVNEEGEEKLVSKTYLGEDVIFQNDEQRKSYYESYFTIESLEDDNVISFKNVSKNDYAKTISWSTDLETWTEVTSNTSGAIITTLNTNDVVYIKGNNITYGGNSTGNYYNYFVSTKTFNLSGNIMSLLYGDDFIGRKEFPAGSIYTFHHLFGSSKVISAKNLKLPATTLCGHCYRYMFNNCKQLIEVPLLPAKNLATYCYSNMFTNCTSLTQAPVLPAIVLDTYCYWAMFEKCTSLVISPELPALKLGQYCYGYMFNDCTSLAQAPVLPAIVMEKHCYERMFRGCTSLLIPPALPARSLAEECYSRMFLNCSKLTQAPELPAERMAQSCYAWMFENCSKLETAPALPSTILDSSCYNGIFAKCISLEEPPELPAMIMKAECYSYMFSGCTSLEQVPELPATALDSSCYGSMFKDCVSITEIPEDLLPATVLQPRCYGDMFNGCAGITEIPEDLLHATALASQCYERMFYGCTSLVEIPEDLLPATNLTVTCYGGMFQNCTSLTEIPTNLLHATIMKNYCYNYMFDGCTSLVQAPDLPATNLAYQCYKNMFSGCTSLVQAPILPAETITDQCYVNMFNGCTSLNHVQANFIVLPLTAYTENWLQNVSSTGTFVTSCYREWNESGDSGIPVGWNIEYYDIDYLTIEPLENGTLSFSKSGLQYSLDKENWNNLGTSQLNVVADIPVYIKGTMTPSSTDGIGTFTITNEFEISGSIMSLLYGDDYSDYNDLINKDYAFMQLFKDCSTLISARNLVLPTQELSVSCCEEMFYNCTSLEYAPTMKSTILASRCYHTMFNGCESLLRTPELPATTLADYCYTNMFYSCESLITPSTLPATTLADYCYAGMFGHCTSLINAPALPAADLEDYCYSAMFAGCESLTQAPVLTATTLSEGCYNTMFADCSALITAPELPATTLVESCYNSMFDGCSSLNYIKCLATDISATDCISNWMRNVAAEGTFSKEPEMESWPRGASGIPNSWAVEGSIDYSKKYFTIESTTNNNIISLKNVDCSNVINLSYSLDDGETWSAVPSASRGKTVTIATINNGDTILLKGANDVISIAWNQYNSFIGTNNFDVYGNIMSLLYGDNFISNSEFVAETADVFSGLFRSSTNVVNAENLVIPAVSMVKNACNGMFRDANKLETGPALPSLNLEFGCYSSMFENCIKLKKAPELPATTLAEECYQRMFSMNRNSKVTTPLLTEGPVLPAQTVADRSYKEMFQGNGNLVKITCLARSFGTDSTSNWVKNISSSGTFYKDEYMNSWTTGVNGTPSGWTVVNA